MRRRILSDDDEARLNKLAVLEKLPVIFKDLTLESSQFKEFIKFIGIESDYYPRLIDRLVEKGLFERTEWGFAWFKHELIQKCLNDRLQKQYTHLYQEYHSNAVKFYQSLLEEN